MSLIDNNNLLQALTEFKNRLNDPIYVDPMDVKDQHTAEYCQLAMNNDQTLPASPTGTKTKIAFDLLIASNMVYSTITNSIRLKANKTYKIFACIQVSNSSTVDYFVVNTDSNDSLGYSFGRSIASNYSSTYGEVPYEMIYTPSVDMNISVVAYYNPIDTTIYKYFGKFIVQEITQPVVVEYSKEVSNPLTSTDISQESPVGSIIKYAGVTAPTHYLLCNGAEYPIASYPKLAEAFLNNYGKYNYWGGNGVTTFCVPAFFNQFKTAIPIMTSNTAPEGVVEASSVYAADPNYFAAYKAFDSNLLSGWAPNVIPAQISYQFPQATIVQGYSIMLRYGGNDATYAPKSWTFEGWNGSAWVVMDTKTNIVWDSALEEKFFSSNNAGIAYTKYRVNVSSAYSTMIIIGVKMFTTMVENVSCIKAEPTYYAVNQYGGFESKVLFNGNANIINNYSLIESIENYDYAIICFKTSAGSYLKIDCNTLIYPTNEIVYGQDYQIFIGSMPSPTIYSIIQLHFINNTSFRIDTVSYSSGRDSANIYKIIGIKGKLPTLLTGGEF